MSAINHHQKRWASQRRHPPLSLFHSESKPLLSMWRRGCLSTNCSRHWAGIKAFIKAMDESWMKMADGLNERQILWTGDPPLPSEVTQRGAGSQPACFCVWQRGKHSRRPWVSQQACRRWPHSQPNVNTRQSGWPKTNRPHVLLLGTQRRKTTRRLEATNAHVGPPERRPRKGEKWKRTQRYMNDKSFLLAEKQEVCRPLNTKSVGRHTQLERPQNQTIKDLRTSKRQTQNNNKRFKWNGLRPKCFDPPGLILL